MKRIADFIVQKRLIILIVAAVLLLAFAVCIPFVKVNYNDIEYLPKDSDIVKGLNAMYGDFGENGNASALAQNVDIPEAIRIKQEILAVDGVKSVIFADDLLMRVAARVVAEMQANGGTAETTEAQCAAALAEVLFVLPENVAEMSSLEIFLDLQIKMNILKRKDGPRIVAILTTLNSMGGEYLDVGMLSEFKPQLESFYKNGDALYQIQFDEDDYSQKTMDAIGAIKTLPYGLATIGSASTTYNCIKTVSSETMKALLFAAAIVLIILFLTSSSWWEPVLYLAAIGVAVLINMGSNIVFGKISYMTQGVASVLQLALTIDYSVFYLSRFKRSRQEGLEVEEAASTALQKSLLPILASTLTTVAGFAALMFMRYRMGLDIGLVLTKGIVISFLSVFLVLPGLTVYSHKLIERSEHKTFNLSFNKISNFLTKTRKVLPVVVLLGLLSTVYFQTLNTFTYGSEASMLSEGTDAWNDKQKIEETFGRQNQAVLLLPTEYYSEEGALTRALIALEKDGVLSVSSLSLIEESGFADMLPDAFLSQFKGQENYTRVILMLDAAEEGEETSALLEKIRAVTETHLGSLVSETGKPYYFLGSSPATVEMQKIVQNDYTIITYVSIALVGLVLLFSFKSLILPVLLLLVIQLSIYLNMTFPYIVGEPIVFIGYVLVSAILLGATIDYAILLTNHYMENRQTMNKFDAAKYAMSQSARAIITSAGILTFAGGIFNFITTMPATRVFGMSVFRGGLASFLLVMFWLPALLMLLDGFIRKTTLKGKQLMIDNDLAEPAPSLAVAKKKKGKKEKESEKE